MITTEKTGIRRNPPNSPVGASPSPPTTWQQSWTILGSNRCASSGAAEVPRTSLAFAARHPTRVRAMTILVGAAPTTEDEEAQEIGLNRQARRLFRVGDLAGVRQLMVEAREALLANPLAAFLEIMDKAPEADRVVMADPGWQEGWTESIREALRPGIEGWFDEGLALSGDWHDVDLAAVQTSLTWWARRFRRQRPAQCRTTAARKCPPGAAAALW